VSTIVDSPGDNDQITSLALAAGRGDPRALHQFIEATYRDVWRAVAYLADIDSADDLTQETFLRAIGSLPRFSGRSSARTWLLAIARRAVIDDFRGKRRQPRGAYVADLENVVHQERPSRGFEDIVEVGMLLDGLDLDRRHALLLTQILGLSYAEAAAVCGCPIGTIRSRVARGREDLSAEGKRDGRTG
jgi:RNA polymerase sigma-70 factor, ECF subfamily